MRKLLSVLGNLVFIILLGIIVILIFTGLKSNISGADPSLFGYRVFTVNSGSMIPTLPIGSLVIVKETELNNIQENDIVTYKDSGITVVTHRVVKIAEDRQSFLTRGDANEIDDLFPIESGNLIGKVVFDVPYVGYLMSFLKSKYGVTVLAAGILLMLYVNFLCKSKK